MTALISADKANIELAFSQAAAIDLAGRDVHEAVQVSVNPKVINTPRVAAMAKDGIQLIAIARVTVRANIDRLVGGAGEETILARVGEGIVSSIGSSSSHKAVLENPDSISKTVLAKGPRLRHGVRDPLHRYRRGRCREEHRGRAADRSGRGRQACRSGSGGGTTGTGCCGRAGKPSQGRGDAGPRSSGRRRRSHWQSQKPFAMETWV